MSPVRLAPGKSGGTERASDPSPARVLLIVSSLEPGGAERQVVHLANHLDPASFDVRICSLSRLVPLADSLRDRHRRLHIVERQGRLDVAALARIVRLMRELRVDLVHAFLFDAEMIGRIAARLAGVRAVVASERNADYRRPLLHSAGQWLTRPLYQVMIANSMAGKRFNMRTLRLPESRVRVVHNGVDVDAFRPIDAGSVRRELGLGRDQAVVGMIGSFKRQKNHSSFFRVARAVSQRRSDARFLCVGEPLRDNLQGSGDYHAEMRSLVRELGLEERCLFLGARHDMPEIYNACDVTVLTSRREGTPNVLLESMACGVPVVATAVADNTYVVPDGRVGFVAPVDEDALIAERVSWLLEHPRERRRMGNAARQWVRDEFSLLALGRRVGAVYAECLGHGAPPGARARALEE